MLFSEKAREIIDTQKPVDKSIFCRVKKALAAKDVIIQQSEELDAWLISKGVEAITFSDGSTMIMHTKVSASGFFEEIIHYGQIKGGRAAWGDRENILLMEIEAKEKLIKYYKAYQITDYEVEVLTNVLNYHKVELEELRGGGGCVQDDGR